jgi:dihydroflavonol-4-reductase
MCFLRHIFSIPLFSMILVTGGTGLVGAHVLLELTQKHEKVRALKRTNSSLAIPEKVFEHYQKVDLLSRIEWVEGDVLEVPSLEEAMSGCAQVYHAAALVSFVPKEVQKMFDINVQGTANVVNVALSEGVKKLGYVSSIASLSRYENSKMVTEENYWKPNPHNSNYAISKYLAEQEVWRGTQEGLPAVIINPSVILGPGDWSKGSSQMFQKVWEGLKFYTPGGTGYVDVVDVANSLIALMESEVENERYIVNGENLPYRTIFDWIAEGMSKPKAHILVTPFLKEVAWRIEAIRCFFTGKTPLITKETARQAMGVTAYSNQKIQDFGYAFTPIKESVKKYSEWCLRES